MGHFLILTLELYMMLLYNRFCNSYTHAGGRGQRMVRGESSRASVASITACTPPGATANSLCCLRSRPSSAAYQQRHW